MMDIRVFFHKFNILFLSLVLVFSSFLLPVTAGHFFHQPDTTLSNQSEQTSVKCKITLKYTIGSKKYLVNEEPLWMDTEPEIRYNRTHLVIRYVLQHIPNTTLDWNNEERKVTIRTAEGKVIHLWIGQFTAEVNGVLVEIDSDNPGQVAPYIKNSRTYLPMRFVVEQLNAEVQWLSETQTAVLTVEDKASCQCDWICGSIYNKDLIRKGDSMIQFYFDEQGDNQGTAKIILTENNLEDLNHGLEFEQYLKLYTTDYVCAELCLNQAGNVVKWKATPEKYPNCCNPPSEPEPPTEPPPEPPSRQYSRIIGKITGSSDLVTVSVNGTGETQYSGSFVTDAMGSYQTSKEGEACVIPCPGNFRVTPAPQPGYLFLPSFLDLSITECCPGKSYEANFVRKKIEDKGRIIVKMAPACFEGTTFKITAESTGKAILYPVDYKGIKKEAGTFDTLCTLAVKETYLVEPINQTLLFRPASQTVTIEKSCQDGTQEISFECKNPLKGRIKGNVGRNGQGAKISFLKVGDKEENALIVGTGIKASFDSECVLECGATYIVTPTKERAIFTPSSMQITIKNCCPDGFEIAFFECDFSRNPCCEWEFRPLPEAKNTKLFLCPGESTVVEKFEIANLCEKGSTRLDFTLTWPEDGKITSISPNQFVIDPLHQKTLQIAIKMKDPCEINEVVSFPFMVQCRQCGDKQVNIIAFGKDCWCDKTSYVIKVTKINLREGWLEEIPGGETDPVRFYFDPKEEKWAHIKIGRCIEICVEGRRDKDDNIIFWALDWRSAECLNSIPNLPLPNSIKALYLSYEPDSSWKKRLM